MCVFEENGEYYIYFGGIWGGRTWLRSMKTVELEYNPDGTVKTIEGGG
jgi:hypothetical protein